MHLSGTHLEHSIEPRSVGDAEFAESAPPKSWSSIVGNKNTQNLPAKPEAADEKGSEREKSREPSVHDKIKAKMKEGIELSTEEREILRQKRRDSE